jgi:aminoglycoside phosphotransferase (APT) family kinase protein
MTTPTVDQAPHRLTRAASARLPRQSLSAARRRLPAVLADARSSATPAVRSALWTSTGTAVFRLDEPARTVLRLSPFSDAALQRETEVLAELAGLALPSPLRRLLPARLCAGRVGAWGYVLDREIPGVSGELLVGQPAWAELQADAVAALTALHGVAARRTVVDEALLQRWVDAPVAVVARICGRLPRVTPMHRLDRLRTLLREELAGRQVEVGWAHGDFWAGNLLTEADGRLTGIVDWDLAAPDELALHDLLHLLLYHRRLVSGSETGDLVVGLLAGEQPWTPEEAPVVELARAAFPDGPPSDRVLVLLHWLRHVAAVSVQQRAYVQHSVRVWELRNVHRVLRAV